MTNKQAVAALEQLRTILGMGKNMDVLAELNKAANTQWEQISDYPNYEQNKGSGLVRNIKTKRVLKPDSKGYVKIKNLMGMFTNFKVEVSYA
ncbi:hypothetical protein V3H38_10955 [Vibrio parahaemolyticus]|uniref:hypothetical protein n=1 Tax=Vibrio parahaemolyticus TaxID=670 RepID=UPI00235E43D9|nr:hypothetical protein [Vibrio parahaemolyticus]